MQIYMSLFFCFSTPFLAGSSVLVFLGSGFTFRLERLSFTGRLDFDDSGGFVRVEGRSCLSLGFDIVDPFAVVSIAMAVSNSVVVVVINDDIVM